MLNLINRRRISLAVGCGSILIYGIAISVPIPQSSSTRFAPVKIRKGDAKSGRNVFRFETFGDERFWTDAARLPQGMKDAHVTPLDALKAGVSVDVNSLDPGTRDAIGRELKTDLSAENAPLLNNPDTIDKLLGADAILGIVKRQGKVGITCALCHSMTDGSMYSMPHGGGIGSRLDGRTQNNLNVGKLLSIAANSRAFFPTLQIEAHGKTIGRAPVGLTKDSTEAEVDAYLTNPKYYPIGTFDDTPDGLGSSVYITPLFRQDLAAPYGSSGQNARLEDFGNAVYTILFDMTDLATPGGRAFLKTLGGDAGAQISDDYKQVLADTGVEGYPYLRARTMGKPGDAATPVGKRVDEKKLLDMNAYLVSLRAPRGVIHDLASVSRGRKFFAANCTSCHGLDQSKPVPPILVPMKTIFPGYKPEVLAKRMPPLSPIQNSPGTFDDKMVVVDASPAGKIRGNALPLLLDLDRKPVFLHDVSVHSLDSLLNPDRGQTAPHPFYVRKRAARNDVANFLRSLGTQR